jgi:hypothetical protein
LITVSSIGSSDTLNTLISLNTLLALFTRQALYTIAEHELAKSFVPQHIQAIDEHSIEIIEV